VSFDTQAIDFVADGFKKAPAKKSRESVGPLGTEEVGSASDVIGVIKGTPKRRLTSQHCACFDRLETTAMRNRQSIHAQKCMTILGS
jgi:hypothetical protein